MTKNDDSGLPTNKTRPLPRNSSTAPYHEQNDDRGVPTHMTLHGAHGTVARSGRAEDLLSAVVAHTVVQRAHGSLALAIDVADLIHCLHAGRAHHLLALSRRAVQKCVSARTVNNGINHGYW